jgi:hypothetical protein
MYRTGSRVLQVTALGELLKIPGSRDDLLLSRSNHHTTMLSPQLLLSFLLAFSLQPDKDHVRLNAPALMPPAGAGFTEAVFDAATLNTIMANGNCEGLRFYNVLPDGANTSTVMVIGAAADGSELSGSLFAKAYKAAAGLQDDHMIVHDRSKSAAAKGCLNMANGGSTSFSASFAKADVLTLLGQSGCNGLRVSPAEANGSITMKLESVTIAHSAATVLGSGSGFDLVCGDPCPSFCGSPLSHYVNDEVIPSK